MCCSIQTRCNKLACLSLPNILCPILLSEGAPLSQVILNVSQSYPQRLDLAGNVRKFQPHKHSMLKHKSWPQISIKVCHKIARISIVVIPERHKTVSTMLCQYHDNTGIPLAIILDVSVIPNDTNGKEATINRALDDSTYPS